MARHRRIGPILLSVALGVLTGLFAVLTSAGSASATPYTNQVTCAVSSSNPQSGGSLRVSGTGFKAGATLTITLHTATYQLGTATTDSAGAFGRTVRLPAGLSGSHTVVVRDGATGDTCATGLSIGSGSSPETVAPNTGTSHSTGSTAYTGVAVLSLSGVGVLLLIGGAVLLVTGRRRTHAS